MHRYLVEHSFAPGSRPATPPSACSLAPPDLGLAGEGFGVTWLRSYLSVDDRRSFCIVDGPSPEAVRQAASAGGLPVDRINEVRELDRGTAARAATFLHLPQELP
jgi:hypothetical protein